MKLTYVSFVVYVPVGCYEIIEEVCTFLEPHFFIIILILL